MSPAPAPEAPMPEAPMAHLPEAAAANGAVLQQVAQHQEQQAYGLQPDGSLPQLQGPDQALQHSHGSQESPGSGPGDAYWQAGEGNGVAAYGIEELTTIPGIAGDGPRYK